MRKLFLMIILTASICSCKKETEPTILGNWISSDSSFQFTISNTDGIGQFSNFSKYGNTLVWNFNDEVRAFTIISVNPESMVLRLYGVDYHFRRFR